MCLDCVQNTSCMYSSKTVFFWAQSHVCVGSFMLVRVVVVYWHFFHCCVVLPWVNTSYLVLPLGIQVISSFGYHKHTVMNIIVFFSGIHMQEFLYGKYLRVEFLGPLTIIFIVIIFQSGFTSLYSLQSFDQFIPLLAMFKCSGCFMVFSTSANPLRTRRCLIMA